MLCITPSTHTTQSLHQIPNNSYRIIARKGSGVISLFNAWSAVTSDKDEATIKRSGSRNKRKRTTFNQGDGASKRNGNSFLSDKAFNILRSRIFVPRASSVRAVLAP